MFDFKSLIGNCAESTSYRWRTMLQKVCEYVKRYQGREERRVFFYGGDRAVWSELYMFMCLITEFKFGHFAVVPDTMAITIIVFEFVVVVVEMPSLSRLRLYRIFRMSRRPRERNRGYFTGHCIP